MQSEMATPSGEKTIPTISLTQTNTTIPGHHNTPDQTTKPQIVTPTSSFLDPAKDTEDNKSQDTPTDANPAFAHDTLVDALIKPDPDLADIKAEINPEVKRKALAYRILDPRVKAEVLARFESDQLMMAEIKGGLIEQEEEVLASEKLESLTRLLRVVKKFKRKAIDGAEHKGVQDHAIPPPGSLYGGSSTTSLRSLGSATSLRTLGSPSLRTSASGTSLHSMGSNAELEAMGLTAEIEAMGGASIRRLGSSKELSAMGSSTSLHALGSSTSLHAMGSASSLRVPLASAKTERTAGERKVTWIVGPSSH